MNCSDEYQEQLTQPELDLLVTDEKAQYIYGSDKIFAIVDETAIYELKNEVYYKVPPGGYDQVQE